jgi:hypothetical protein
MLKFEYAPAGRMLPAVSTIAAALIPYRRLELVVHLNIVLPDYN